jgi:pimeloyl-ACP methyl ester carboxylesterase
LPAARPSYGDGVTEDGTTVLTVDGRRVAVAEYGDPAGRPVFLLHGIPASRLGNGFADRPARERGARVIAPDRPGIGGSAPLPGRTIGGYAHEVTALADALGIDRFAVVGYSAGAPYAIAAAAGAADRVRAVALMAGAGPVADRDGARDGMAASDLQMLDLSVRNPRRAARILRVQGLVTRIAPGLALRSIAGELSAADRAALAGGTGRSTLRSFVEAMRQGGGGVVADYRLYAGVWDVAWANVTVPVEIFQGDADGFVPMHHAEDFVARLPSGLGRLHPLAGVGHISITARFGDILDAVIVDG